MSANPWARPVPIQDKGPDCTPLSVAQALALTSNEGVDYSFTYIRHNARAQIGMIGAGYGGQWLRTVMSAVRRAGVCEVSHCPDDWTLDKQPNPDAYEDAERRLDWWELEPLGDTLFGDEEKRVDDALSMPHTVVLISHRIDQTWVEAGSDTVLGYTGGDYAHTGILCAREGDVWRYRNTAGPDWGDRGTVLMRKDIIRHNEGLWRVTYRFAR